MKWPRTSKYTEQLGPYTCTAYRVGKDWKFILFRNKQFVAIADRADEVKALAHADQNNTQRP